MPKPTGLPATTLDFATAADGWADARSATAQALWAKSGDETGHLTLPQHLVDSACTASALFDTWLSPSTTQLLTEKLGLIKGELRSLTIWLAGTHDIGKACKTFQTKIEPDSRLSYLLSLLDDAGLPRTQSRHEIPHKMPHGVVSAVIVTAWLKEHGVPPATAVRLGEIAGAHHGIASPIEDYGVVEIIVGGYEPEWAAVHRELLDGMAELAGVHPALQKLSSRPAPSAAALQLLTGLVVLADWIASNADAFPMETRGSQRDRLILGMQQTDLTSPWCPSEMGDDLDELFRTSFGWPDGYSPRSIQHAMATVASEVSEPTLIILEAGTGQGKTEAALAAAQILGQNVGAQGIYFAAPTMATANGLLERTLRWASRSGQDHTVASMYLAHSKNQLAQEYRQLKLRGIAPEESEKGGEVVASSWMSGRRRGLLSNIVVGTVDQVLMVALQQRYSMLRHIALAGKIVIFDEVHSFDTYTSAYLERTLEWLAYYGVSVIMLSATLPRGRREALIEAYTGERPTESHDAYPLISIASESSLRFEAPKPPPPELTARVQLLDDDLPTVTDTLEDLLADGGCALITCNTIARAQETYSAVSELFPGEAELHHAGFMAWERTQREDALRRKLGPTSHRGDGRPDRLIVVATQVAEQSLDIDADVLITDIAPMDLLIQRAGRIHRHDRPVSDRPEKLRTPRIYVRGITQTDPVPEFDGGAEAIYGARLLLATLLRLPEQFTRPDDVPNLVQSVYGDVHDIPEAWEAAWNDALRAEQEREARARSRAQDFRVPTPFQQQPLAGLFGRCASAVIRLGDEERGAAQVRDAEPTVEVIPIVRTQYGYRPLGDHPEILETGDLSYAEAFHLASSVVRLPARMTRYTNDFEAVVGTLEERTPPHWQNHFLLKGQLALLLDEDHVTQLGHFWVRYSTELGLEHGFEKEGRMSAP